MTKKIIIIGLISAVAVTGFYIYKRNKRTTRRRRQQQQQQQPSMEPAPRIDEIGVPIPPVSSSIVPPKFENLEITF